MILLLPPPLHFSSKKIQRLFFGKITPSPPWRNCYFCWRPPNSILFWKIPSLLPPVRNFWTRPCTPQGFLKGHSFESTIVAYLSEELWGKNKNAKQAFIFIFKFLIKASIRQQHFFASLKSGAVTLAFHGGIKQKVSKNSLTNSCYC